MRRLQSRFRDAQQIPEVSSTAFRTQPPEFTTSALDGYGLRGQWPARPTPYASDPVLVHRLVRLLHASFRPRLATTPLRFAMTSPPSGCQRDFHPRAVEHARHTTKKRLVTRRAANLGTRWKEDLAAVLSKEMIKVSGYCRLQACQAYWWSWALLPMKKRNDISTVTKARKRWSKISSMPSVCTNNGWNHGQ